MVIYMWHSLLASLHGLLSMCLCVPDIKRAKIHTEEFPQNDAAKQKMYQVMTEMIILNHL